MQQYSSLPEQNPTLFATIQQLRADLWLESSLNQLQSRLNDSLDSVFTTNKLAAVLEAEIFQTVVNEVNTALNTHRVVIAQFQAEEKVCKVCYVFPSPSQCSQPQLVGVMMTKGKTLLLRLNEVIDIEDLQQIENQQPPSAWSISSNTGSVMGWLILPICSDYDSVKNAPTKLRSHFMECAVSHCAAALVKLRHIQSLQQRCQQLESHNQELERTNKLKNQFLANTSHEIRTPLSSIIGFTHLLLAQGYDPTKERHQEYLNIIQSSGKHLLDLINDILDLSKIEANQLEVQLETVNLPTLCRNILALVKEKAANKDLKLRLDLDPGAKILVVDPLRLKQMLLNLLFNALKFTTTGTVGLQVKPNSLFMHFTVWDTGSGISKEHQPELFQPYFQIANAIAGKNQGTGLGLALTRKLAELHGGWVEMESEVARGSRFTIVLPLTPVGEALEAEEAGSLGSPLGFVALGAAVREKTSSTLPDSPLPTPNSPNILLVEDDLPNAQLIQIYLGKLAYQVTWVKNAAEMWLVLTQLHPAVILMDVYLPDSNGLELVQQLRESQQYRTIPVIAQTSMAMKGDREKCLVAGVNDYISKPIDLPLLATLVSKYSKPSIKDT